MKLSSLLPIGRSFETSNDRTGRFRPAEPGMVPDFSNARSTGTEGAPGVVTAAARREDASVVAGIGGVSVAPRTSGMARPRGGRRFPVWLEEWILNLFRPGNRRRGSRVVQTELCLREVKPMRNDLMTSDVEVVPVPPSGRSKPLSASCRARLMALWWAPVARRFRRWGRTNP